MATTADFLTHSATDYNVQVFSNTTTHHDGHDHDHEYCDGHENVFMDKFFDEVLKQILIVLGIFINSIAIWILVSHKKMQNMFLHLLALSLVANNGFMIMALITTLFYEFKVKTLAGIVSYMSIPFKEIFFTASVLITVAMAYERYTTLDVGKGYRTRMKVKALRYQRLKKYILFLCIVCPIVNIHEFFSHDERAKRTDLWKSSGYRHFIQFKWLIFLGISTIILLVLNYKVFSYVTKTIERTQEQDVPKKQTIQINDKPVRKNSRKESFKRKRKFVDNVKRHEKLSFALFGIVICKFVFNTFYVVELIFKTYLKDHCHPSYQKNFEIIVRLMRIINAMSNTAVYCIADRTFRRYIRFYLKRIFYPMFCKLIPVLEPTTVDEDSSTHPHSRPGDQTPLTRTPLGTPQGARRFQTAVSAVKAANSMQDLRRPSNLSADFRRPSTDFRRGSNISQDIKNPLERVKKTTLGP